MRPDINDIEVLRQTISYDPETGKLLWLERPIEFFAHCQKMGPDPARRSWNSRCAGKEAFTSQKKGGYYATTVFYKQLLAHRVAWALHYGRWPDGPIDHINGNPSDNRIKNLRDASFSENSRNQKKNSKNTSGATGVSYYKRVSKWVANIKRGGKAISLGYYEHKFDAILARLNAEKSLGFHINHGVDRSFAER